MPIDLTLPTTLGVHALQDLAESVHATKQLSVMSAMLATKALHAGQTADTIISEIAKINPALVGRRIRRHNLATKKFPEFRLFPSPTSPFEKMIPSTIQLTRTASPGIPMHPMRFPTLVRGVENVHCIIGGSAVQRSLALQTFL